MFHEVAIRYPAFDFFVLFDRQVLKFRFPKASRVIRALDWFVYGENPRFGPTRIACWCRFVLRLWLLRPSDQSSRSARCLSRSAFPRPLSPLRFFLSRGAPLPVRKARR